MCTSSQTEKLIPRSYVTVLFCFAVILYLGQDKQVGRDRGGGGVGRGGGKNASSRVGCPWDTNTVTEHSLMVR